MKQVLYIGDENLIIKALKSEMESVGHELKIIQSPFEAMADLFISKYDLIITNAYHEEIDGIQLFNTLSHSSALNSITPFVLITSGEKVEKLFSEDNKPLFILKNF